MADAIAAGNAALIVHGIDYNHNGIYDNVLDRSELNNSLPGEATAPAPDVPPIAKGPATPAAIVGILSVPDVLRVSTDELRKHCRQQGMETLREAGLKALFSGITTIEEVVRETVLEEESN